MVNITVSYTGDVTGDNGKIIGYEGSEYSEVIYIVHPIFTGAKYYIEYKYGNTICRNELDSAGQVSIRIDTAGYVKCQFIAIDITTGNILFKSNTWNFIIKKSLKIEPSHYPCNAIGHRYNDRRPQVVAGYYYDNHYGFIPNIPDSFNAYEAYTKLSNELENEEDIRFDETNNLKKEVEELKKEVNSKDKLQNIIIDELNDITHNQYVIDFSTGIGISHDPETFAGDYTQLFKLKDQSENSYITYYFEEGIKSVRIDIGRNAEWDGGDYGYNLYVAYSSDNIDYTVVTPNEYENNSETYNDRIAKYCIVNGLPNDTKYIKLIMENCTDNIIEDKASPSILRIIFNTF